MTGRSGSPVSEAASMPPSSEPTTTSAGTASIEIDSHCRLRRICARSMPTMPISSSRKVPLEGSGRWKSSQDSSRNSSAPPATMPSAISASRSGGHA